MEHDPTAPQLPTPSSSQTLEEIRAQLKKSTIQFRIKPEELREKAKLSLEKAWDEVNNDPYGEYTDPKQKAVLAIKKLSPEVQQEVLAHGIGTNRSTADNNPHSALEALINILGSGILKGSTAPLSGGINQQVFTSSPFILLSNRGEQLAEHTPTGFRLTGLRTVLVNGGHEHMVQDLRDAFPGVSFRTADELSDTVFDKKEPRYESVEQKVSAQAQELFARQTGS